MPDERRIPLVEAAVRGDLNSFGKLCEEFYAPMVAVAYAVLGDHHLAEDAAQEAFAKALAGLRGLQEPAKFGAWLARICRNVATDAARARIRNGRAAELWAPPPEPTDDGLPASVRRALGRLPASARELIVLRYYDNLSYDQISSVLGISRSAINGRLNRAKKKLARAMKREGVLEL
ncbi:MAG: RNA polymerase sigma factor [Phycisphaerae bacterium]|nr:RNA polymerase sigma factor [Phycisphaerae bacterium]